MPAYYRNETLFSEIYLAEITRQPEQEDILASLKVLREYREYADTSSLEKWTNSYVHEVLAALGFNVKIATPSITFLYPIGNSDRPISLCLVTLPDESLDNTLLGRNWAEKTIRALRGHIMQWGFLTNGKLLRIYHLDESIPYETYLEIDLEKILNDQAKDAYQIFYKFMKSGNFTIGEDGKCQFDHFKQDSKNKIDYIEKELANALKQREEGGKGVLSDLCMGYVEEIRASAKIDLDDELQRRKIYHGAMLYMFRLLFLLYAEARGLLSEDNAATLAAVKTDAAALHNGETIKSGDYSLWEQLSTIFVDIDQTYNGGLFSPQESEFTRFIEETRVANRFLAETLFNLITYHEKDGRERPISYRDMSVRHLGTLYEGLLEHKLFITKENTEVRVTKGAIEFIPASRGGKLVQGHYLPPGAVYFGSDPSERKLSGSYFTREDVVDFIANKTVGEKLNELKTVFMTQEKANVVALRHAVDKTESAALARLFEENALKFVREKILALSVLDPAMGSGHFLVNAANLIANFVTEVLNEEEIEGNANSSTASWRRWVVENCIYGVDLNPLAVELAKLSLWILTMAKDQPLSFMNHHLKCGNSLVGASLENVGVYPFSKKKSDIRQLSFFDQDKEFKTAVENAITKVRLIASKGSVSLNDVSEKKALLDEIERVLKIYKLICNVHTRLQLGSVLSEDQYSSIISRKNISTLKDYDSEIFIHWELEFPEVLLKSHGFDIIIGNPPYANIPSEISKYVEQVYASFDSGDLYTLFLEKVIMLNKSNGYCGLVLPLSLTFSESMQSVRKDLLTVLNRDWKVSSFDRIPDALFGGNVRTRNSILIGVPNNLSKNNLLTSPMYRWFARERKQLFSSIRYVNINDINKSGGGWAKIGSEKQVELLRTLFRKKAPLSSSFSKTNNEHCLFFSSTAYNWLTVTKKKPPVYDIAGNLLEQTKYGSLKFESENDTWFALSVLTSTFSYWYWLVYGDGFDVTKKLLGSIPLAPSIFSNLDYLELVSLGKVIQKDMEEHIVYKLNAGKKIGNYNLRLSRHITTKADEKIFEAMGFSDEYLTDIMDFCNYMIKTELSEV